RALELRKKEKKNMERCESELDLPALAKIGRGVVLLLPRERRQGNGGRPKPNNGARILEGHRVRPAYRSTADHGRLIGLRKTPRIPHGRTTRHENRLGHERVPPPNSSSAQSSMADIVLCKVHRKTTSMRELEQMAAMEYRRAASQGGTVSATSEQKNSQPFPFDEIINMEIKEEFEEVPVEMLRDGPEVTSTSVVLPQSALC
ncbi:hypothetical protein HPP92_028016, partial [Vanilla planifolia]